MEREREGGKEGGKEGENVKSIDTLFGSFGLLPLFSSNVTMSL